MEIMLFHMLHCSNAESEELFCITGDMIKKATALALFQVLITQDPVSNIKLQSEI